MKGVKQMMPKKLSKVLTCCLAVVLLFSATACANKPAAEKSMHTGVELTHTKAENGKNIRLGAYVWYGYANMAWQLYSERYMENLVDTLEPAWGYGYNEVADMEYQIDLAVEYGLSFFAFEYWWNQKPTLHERMGLDNFMKSKNNANLDFTLLVANHDTHRIYYDNWQEICLEHFIPYMTKDNYLKVDGKPVISFFEPDFLIADLGGVERTKECFDWLRSQMQEQGYPGVLILAGDQSSSAPNYINNASTGVANVPAFQKRIANYLAAGYDAAHGSLTYRQYIPNPGTDETRYLRSYDSLLDLHEKSWEVFAEHTDIPFAPGLASGWDDRLKWNVFSPPSYYYLEGKTPQRFYEHILKAHSYIQQNPDQALGNIAYIYAWDETDEGAYLIPTKAEGNDMLEAMRRAIDTINAQNP